MNFIAIDLELEQPNTNKQTPDSLVDQEKIIQVGLVVFSLGEDEPIILDSQTIHLRYEGKLSNFIKNLTGIEESDLVSEEATNAINVIYKISELQQKYGTSRQIVEWGSGDCAALRDEAGFSVDNWVTKAGLARGSVNVKNLFQVYALANGLKAQGGLSKSMGKLGLGFKNTHYNGKNRGTHWAESDALNTAIMFNKIVNLMRK